MFGLKLKFFSENAPARRQETEGSMGAYRSSRATGIATGLTSGTLIATAMGWRPVEAIVEGDLVLTFDHGLQPVRTVVRDVNWSGPAPVPPTLWPLMVPAGALGNQTPMSLLPDQAVLVESDTAEALYGDPFTLIAAADLEGLRGIARLTPDTPFAVVQLHFDRDEVVFAQGGALVLCKSLASTQLDAMFAEDTTTGYRTLPADEAHLLVDCMIDEDAAAGDILPPARPVQPARYAAAFG